MKKKINPMTGLMLAVMTVGLLGAAVFGVLRYRYGYGWAMPFAITCGMFAYHMIIRLLGAAAVHGIAEKRCVPDSRWFREKPWEKGLYRALRVKKWKGRALTYDPSCFSLKLHTPEEVLKNMCCSELVHEALALLSFSSLLFAIPFGAFWAFFATALAAAVYDLSFAAIQRYNRPRLRRLVMRSRAPAGVPGEAPGRRGDGSR